MLNLVLKIICCWNSQRVLIACAFGPGRVLFVRNSSSVFELQVNSYISTSSTTSTLRLPLYILSVVDAYQKAYGTGKRVMVMMVIMYCEK